MNKEFDTIFFDMDGTLVDSYKLHGVCIHNCLLAHGYENISLETVLKYIGNTFEEVLTSCKVNKNDFSSIISTVDSYYESTLKEQKELAHLVDGAIELLKLCKEEGYKTGIVSNSKKYLIKIILEINDAKELFNIVSGASITALNKNERCELAMKTINAKNCLYIGDTINDILLARKFNMKSVIIDNKIGWCKDYSKLIREESPDYVFSNIEDVKTLIK